MSFGPGGYEDDWEDDDGFDFGDADGTDYSTRNFYSSENSHSSTEHVKANSSPFAPKVNGHVTHTASQVNQATTKAPFGRGRGRGGFSTPPKTQNSNMTKKKGNVNKNRQAGQGNFLFARTTSGKSKAKQQSDEKNSEIAEDLRAAILKGDAALVVNILNQGISVDYILKSGWTGLMHAANCGFFAIVAVLTERGANVNFQKDMFSVVMAACSSDCDVEEDLVQCVNHLIENGAKVNSHDRYHMTPLMYASRNGRSQIVGVLLRHKCDVNKQDQRGWSALGWAASRGHGRVVRMLLDENANPKQYTNDGQSAEDLAYDGGFTIVADILNTAVNPSRRQDKENPSNPYDGKSLNEEDGCVRYGELELFLFGLELGHLVPLIKDQKISFDAFLQLTDADLQQIGISQIGIRKKILTATHDVHTKQWDLSSLPSQQSSTQFTSEDMNLVLANVEKHLLYIRCSVGYARKSLLGMEDPAVVVQDKQHARQFLDKTSDVLSAVSGISEEVSNLERCINKICSAVPSSPADLISVIPEANTKQNSSFALPVLFVGGCVAFGLIALYLNRDQ